MTESAFGVEHGYGQISKLGSPKVNYVEGTLHERAKSGEEKTYHPNKVATKYEGKSLILRRPKYSAVAYPGRLDDKKKMSAHSYATLQRHPVPKKTRYKIAEANRTGAKKLDLGLGAVPHKVNKAFDSERGRMKRADAYSTSATAVGGAGALAAGHQGHQAFRDLKRAASKGKSIPKAELKTGGRGALTALALGTGAGAAFGVGQKIKRSKKSGSWAS